MFGYFNKIYQGSWYTKILSLNARKPLLMSFFCTFGAQAIEVEFNSAFLPDVDLSLYQTGNPVMSGQYRADVLLNGQLMFRQNIQINSQKDGRNPVICVTRPLLEQLGVDITKLLAEAESSSNEDCQSLPNIIPDASADFTPENHILNISIPQAFLLRTPRGYVNPELWDQGITAALFSYQLNSYRNRTSRSNDDSAFGGLTAGFNVGSWRFRHKGSISWQRNVANDYSFLHAHAETEDGALENQLTTAGVNNNQSRFTYRSSNSYLQRDVTALKSQLTLGESNTSGEIFDTLPYRGIQLASDDRMVPFSMRGYAPVIRGVARSNARVTISQAGNLLQQTTVSPGAFIINDLYAIGYGGDLHVTVLEDDGAEHSFIVPYASVSQLLRPETMRFSLTAGEYHNNFSDQHAKLLQGTLQYGLNNTFTVFTGAQFSNYYTATLGGLAFGTPIGAIAIDITHAETKLAADAKKGQSIRLSYSKNFHSTGSNFTLAAYRFSKRNFLDFNNAMQLLHGESKGFDTSWQTPIRSRLSLTANQDMGGWGQLAISGFTQRYWSRAESDLQYQFSYSNQYKQLSYSFSANRNRTETGKMENSLMLAINLPLDFAGGSAFRPQLTAQVGRDPYGHFRQQASLSGSAGEDRQYNYSASISRDGASNSNNTALSGQYTGAHSTLSASLGHGKGYSSASLGASGTMVAHVGGITLSPYQGETMALLSAPGAKGARVMGYSSLRLDSKGNALVPYLRAYELNEVAIDPRGSSVNVELNESSQQVVPRAGAVVRLQYGTNQGRALLLTVHQDDGSALPFGASVVDDEGNSVGMVGQGGQLYARIKPETRQLLVKWGTEAHQQCALVIPAVADDESHLQQANALCSPSQQVTEGTPTADTLKVAL